MTDVGDGSRRRRGPVGQLLQHAAIAAVVGSGSFVVPLSARAETPSGQAAGGQSLALQDAAKYMRYDAGNDHYRIELAPNYSEDLGFSLKGAAGSYLTDDIALGLIVEYGANQKEYLTNAGLRFNDALKLVGSVGLLDEDYEYIAGLGRKSVLQMEYGASLQSTYEFGIIRGFELNGYATNANIESNTVEAGQLYGLQLLAEINPTDATTVTFGGGYELLNWDGGESSGSVAFSAEGIQQLGDMLSLTGNVKLGASEYVYGGGFAIDFSRGTGGTNSLALRYSYIDGRNGVQTDQRVDLSWTMGFGTGEQQVASQETGDVGPIRPTADVAFLPKQDTLLDDVMQRPGFLPETVVARAKPLDPPPSPPPPPPPPPPQPPPDQACSDLGIKDVGFYNYESGLFLQSVSTSIVLNSETTITIDGNLFSFRSANPPDYFFDSPATTPVENRVYEYTLHTGDITCKGQAQGFRQ